MSADQAAAMKLPWRPGIAEWLANERPVAVLTGAEPVQQLEQPIVQEMTQLGYSPLRTPSGFVLWRRPDLPATTL